jgi:hypothetical protein
VQFIPKADSSLPTPRAEWLAKARADAARRAKEHFGCEVQECVSRKDLLRECVEKGVASLLMMQPFVGPLRDELCGLPENLAVHGIKLVRLRRKWDSVLLPHAARGFFPFWNKVGRLLAKSGPASLA